MRDSVQNAHDRMRLAIFPGRMLRLYAYEIKHLNLILHILAGRGIVARPPYYTPRYSLPAGKKLTSACEQSKNDPRTSRPPFTSPACPVPRFLHFRGKCPQAIRARRRRRRKERPSQGPVAQSGVPARSGSTKAGSRPARGWSDPRGRRRCDSRKPGPGG